MNKVIELKIKNSDKIYEELTEALSEYRKEPERSIAFIVEGTKDNPLIAIKYPGKKVVRRKLKRPRSDSALWSNLYDFEVIPYKDGKEIQSKQFTFEELVKDFNEHKKGSEEFWEALNEVYEHNILPEQVPELPGIDPELYLRVIKWIWIQEDFNYRFSWEDVKSPVKYVLTTRTGTPTRKGAGRAKSFAGLFLLRNGFNIEQVGKIIPFF